MCCKIVPKVIHRKCGQLAGKLCRFVILSKNRVFGIHFQTCAAACKRACSMPGGWPQTQCLIPDEWACGDGMQLPRYALVGVQPCSPRGSCRLAGAGMWSGILRACAGHGMPFLSMLHRPVFQTEPAGQRRDALQRLCLVLCVWWFVPVGLRGCVAC